MEEIYNNSNLKNNYDEKYKNINFNYLVKHYKKFLEQWKKKC